MVTFTKVDSFLTIIAGESVNLISTIRYIDGAWHSSQFALILDEPPVAAVLTIMDDDTIAVRIKTIMRLLEPTLSFPDQGLTLLNGSPTKWPNLGIIYKINGKWITRNKKDKTRTRKTGCR
jgi:hypothetical protein